MVEPGRAVLDLDRPLEMELRARVRQLTNLVEGRPDGVNPGRSSDLAHQPSGSWWYSMTTLAGPLTASSYAPQCLLYREADVLDQNVAHRSRRDGGLIVPRERERRIAGSRPEPPVGTSLPDHPVA